MTDLTCTLDDAQQLRRFAAGKTLFHEGDDPVGIYIVHSGEVDLVFSSRTGVRKPLRKVGPTEIVGLSDVISGTKRDCTARTRTAARIGYVPAEEFRRLLAEEPSLWFSIARMLSIDVNSCFASMRALVAR